MGIKYELEEAEVQVLMQYIDAVVRTAGLVEAENALHLTRILKSGYDAHFAKKRRGSSAGT